MSTTRTVVVPRGRAGDRLDRFLARELHLPLARVRELVAGGQVRVRERTCSPLRRLFGGEEIQVALPSPRAMAAGADEPPVAVLLEGEGFAVVDKPAGLPVEPAGPRSPSVVGAVARILACDVAGRAAPGLAHRIDRDTSGCLLLARTDAGLAALRRAFEEGRVEKTYLALVAGQPPDAGRLDTPHARDPADPRRFTGRVPSPRRARLSFRVERRLAGAALLEVSLETGRTHQIRVQLAEAGWPILGDATYGVPSAAIGRQALHAWRLAFPRPDGSGEARVESPLPPDLAHALEVTGRP